MEKKKQPSYSRRNFIRTGALAGAMSAAGAFGYARWLEPGQFSITRKNIIIPDLPPGLNGFTIAHLTDFHYQPDQQYDLMAEAVAASNAAEPDLVALTGDFITHTPEVLPPLMEHLSRLQAKHGVYGVMGNHDGWHTPHFVFRGLFRKAGFEFLVNDGSRININGDSLHILGTDSIWSGTLDLPACYQGYHKNDPVIALVHEPDVFDIITENHPVSLQLSGHTHGGQCRVPLIGYAPAKVKYGQKYIYGEFSKNQSKLFVSRGVGTVGLTVRFACAPELAILTLQCPS